MKQQQKSTGECTDIISVESKPKFRAVSTKRDNVGQFASINVRDLANDLKLGNVIQAFEAFRLDVLCIQEVQRRGVQEPIPVGEDSTLAYVGYKNKSIAGVGFLFSCKVQLDDVKLISARIALANICIGGLKLAFLSCYAPPDTESHAGSTKHSFYAELSKVVKNHVKRPHKVCVLSDFNASIGTLSHGGWRSCRQCDPNKWQWA